MEGANKKSPSSVGKKSKSGSGSSAGKTPGHAASARPPEDAQEGPEKAGSSSATSLLDQKKDKGVISDKGVTGAAAVSAVTGGRSPKKAATAAAPAMPGSVSFPLL